MPDSKVKLTPATLEDVRPFFYGGLPEYRLQAWVAKVDNVPVGVGGVYFLEDGTRVGFVELTDEGYRYPKDLLRATKKFLQVLRDEGVPRIIAVADPGIEAAERFMLHFGFKPGGQLAGHTVYYWTSKD